MAAITTRQTAGGGATVAGIPLTNAQLDTNFININLDLPQKFVVSSGQTPGTNIYHGILLDTGTLWTSDHIGKLDYRLISYGQGGGSNGTSLDHEISGFISYYRNTAAGDEVATGLIDRTHRVYTPIAATIYIVKIKSNGNLGIAFDFGLNSFSTLYITRLVGQLANVGANNWTVHSRYFTGTDLTTALNNTTNFYYVTFASAINSISYTDTIVAPYTNSFIRWSGNTNKTEHLRLDSNGNLGLGIAPSAWGAGWKSYTNQLYGEYYSNNGGFVGLAANAVYNGTNWIYKNTTTANRFESTLDSFRWFTAPGGTVGNAISFTQAMTLGSDNNLLVGKTSTYRSGRLVVAAANLSQTSSQANLHVTTTDTQAADIGGSIGLGGQVGGDEAPFAYISGRKENSTSGNYAGYLAFATQNAAAAVAERMRLTSSGNLGIGVTNPVQRLEVSGNIRTVAGSGGTLSVFETDGTRANHCVIGADANGSFINATFSTGGSAVLRFQGANTERMRIDASGNLGVGTTTVTSRLDVVGTDGQGIQFRTGTRTVGIGQVSSQASLYWGSTTDLTFFSGSERARITGGGQFAMSSAGTAAAPVITKSDDLNTGIFFPAADTIAFAEGGVESMRIDANGNLGIGTTSPGAARLVVSPSVLPGVHSARTVTIWSDLYNAGTNGQNLVLNTISNGTNYLGWNLATDWGGRLSFGVYTNAYSTTPTEALTIINSGNVGIGIANPSVKLDVRDTAAATVQARTTSSGNAALIASTAAGGTGYLQLTNAAGDHYIYGGVGGTQNISFAINGEKMRLDSSGNLIIGTTTAEGMLTVSAPANVGYGSFNVATSGFGSINLKIAGTAYAYLGSANAFITGGTASDFGFRANNAMVFSSGGGTERVRITSAGNVGIGTINPGYKLEVAGSFAATTKSFVIDHPTKPGMKLRYGSLEGPENGVYVRGRTTNGVIVLPEYWTKLVDPDSITVNLTPVGTHQKLYVDKIESNCVYVLSDGAIDCFYTVFAERVDVDKLQVEV